LDTPS